MSLLIPYLLKIGIPAFIIGYAAKIHYQEKYVKNILPYMEEIKKLDTECKMWENETGRLQRKLDKVLSENVELKGRL